MSSLKSIGRTIKWVWRCAKLGLSEERIFLGTPPGHFYSPIPQFRELENYDTSNVESIPGIDLRSDSQLALAKTLAPLIADHLLVIEPTPGRRYYLENLYYPYADALLLQAIMRHIKPKRIVEVGSGFSSAAMLDTCDDYSLDTELTFVDPNPERLLGLLKESDARRTTLVNNRIQQVPLEAFTALGNNDILFIDSSHVGKFGSDVNHLLFQIIPRLADGVWIHIHDIFWPFEYPLAWLENGWAWNETYLLRSYLCNNDRIQIELFPSYLEHCHRTFVETSLSPTLQRARQNQTVGGAAIWLRVVVVK